MKVLNNLLFLSAITGTIATTPNDHFAFTRSLVKNPLNTNIYKRTGGGSKTLSNTAFNFELDGTIYISPFDSEYSHYTLEYSSSSTLSLPIPITVINSNDTVTCDSIKQTLDTYSKIDDVWSESFLEGLYIQSPDISPEVKDCYNSSLIFTKEQSGDFLSVESKEFIVPGPYVASSSEQNKIILSPVYRIYNDEYQSFASPAILTEDGIFTSLTSTGKGMNTLGIPVPSRMYTYGFSTPDKPLLGKRVAVKDIYDMAGLKTGGGNRAYFNFYDVPTQHSTPVQKLIDVGATIIGRTKTGQFANGESVDQMSPFNPRGDGYQNTWGSSSGSGSAISAYEWVDFTIGSDTGGSCRMPAGAGGTYANRPSLGAVDLSGVIPATPDTDTACFFAKDPESFRLFGEAWYGDQYKSYKDFPKTLYAPPKVTSVDSYDPEAAQKIYDDFFNNLATFMNATLDDTQIGDIWNETMLEKTDGKSMEDYMSKTFGALLSYQYSDFGKQFIEGYQEVNDGRIPFVNPQPWVRWQWSAENVTESDYTTAQAEKEVFSEFFRNTLLKTNDQTCSESIYLRINNAGYTTYRNLFRDPPVATVTMNYFYFSVFSDTPEITIPIGQIPYQSEISLHEEYLPVTAGLIANKGCDYMLFDLAVELAKAGIIQPIKTGRTAF